MLIETLGNMSKEEEKIYILGVLNGLAVAMYATTAEEASDTEQHRVTYESKINEMIPQVLAECKGSPACDELFTEDYMEWLIGNTPTYDDITLAIAVNLLSKEQ